MSNDSRPCGREKRPRGRTPKVHSTRRLNLELSETVRNRLEALRGEMGADSLAEVIRRSIAIYDYVWNKRQEGFTVTLVTADGRRTEIEFF